MNSPLGMTQNYPLVGVMCDKNGDRVAASPGTAWELIGFDGQQQALKPFAGFRKIAGGPSVGVTGTLSLFKSMVLPNVDRGKTFSVIFVNDDSYYTELGSAGPTTLAEWAMGVGSNPRDLLVVDDIAYLLRKGSKPKGLYVPATNTFPNVFTAGPEQPSLIAVSVENTGGPDAVVMPPGDYAFCVQYTDSVSGRKTRFSEIYTLKEADFGGVDRYLKLDFSGDPLISGGDFNRIDIYRSVMTQSGGGVFAGAILYKEKTAYDADTYYVELGDLELVYQEQKMDSPIVDTDMPQISRGIEYESTVVGSEIYATSSDTLPSPKIRWSSPFYSDPELFAPLATYRTVPGRTPWAFHKAGGNVIALSKGTIYHVRKEGGYLKCQEIGLGYGCVGPEAATSHGSSVYFTHDDGIYMMGGDGSLDRMQNLNYFPQKQWASSMASPSDPDKRVWMASDPLLNAVMILNPEKEQLVIVWLGSGRITEIYDARFDAATTMTVPFDLNDGTSRTVDRAVFLGKDGGIYTTDFLNRKGNSGGPGGYADMDDENFTPQHTLFPYTFETSKAIVSTAENIVAGKIYVDDVIDNSETPNIYIYEMTGDNAGRKWKISGSGTDGTGNYYVVAAYDPLVAEIPAGTIIGVSPVYCRWVGSPVGIKNEDGMDYGGAMDFVKFRHVSSLIASFTDVTGATVDDEDYADYARWRGLVYIANETDPTGQAWPRDNNSNEIRRSIHPNSETQRASAVYNEGSVLTGRSGIDGPALIPGFEVFCPNISWQAVGVTVTGSVLGTDTGKRSTAP